MDTYCGIDCWVPVNRPDIHNNLQSRLFSLQSFACFEVLAQLAIEKLEDRS